MSLDSFLPVHNTDSIVVAIPLGNSVTNVPKGDSFASVGFSIVQKQFGLIRK